MIAFSDWIDMNLRTGHRGPAVYQFRLTHQSEAVSIGRLLKPDPEGTLVIGSTGNLERRADQSRAARLYASGSSTMNLLYYVENYTALLQLFPGCSYDYRFLQVETAEAAKELEGSLLKDYFKTFGELPPLNSVIPDRYSNW